MLAGTSSTPRTEVEQAGYDQSDNVSAPATQAHSHYVAIEQKSWKSKFSRHSLGMFLLLVVVVLWVSSNFLTWTLFSDEAYSKPYLVTYINSVIFSVYLVPWVWRGGVNELRERWKEGERPWSLPDHRGQYSRIESEDADGNLANEGRLGPLATIRLSVEFSILWWLANYFSSACFKYTSAVSGSILSSTSSAWTLLLCVIFGVERFTWPKAAAVAACILGIIIISRNDTSRAHPDASGEIPIRSAVEILLGDFLALIGAVFYGVYTTLLKVRVGDESRVDMQMLFGFSGVINGLTLWPGVIIFHLAGWENFELPTGNRVWWMLAANYTMNLIADVSWAYAIFLTTPLLVTVGLSLTIPVALLGQMILLWEVPGFLYWIGAALVFGAFFLANRESEKEEVRTARHDENVERRVD